MQADKNKGLYLPSRYLRNAWYPAAWADEITRSPLRRILLDDPLVLYRREDGTPVALHDRCPHRFAPLSMGTLVGDLIQCPYHGLRFDAGGICVFNPHGEGTIPRNARVRSLQVVERFGLVWIWAGEPEQADPALLPDFAVLEDPAYACVRGVLHMNANYQLITDNLLDLSHVPYLHPQLRAPNDVVNRHEMRKEGTRVWSMLWRDDALPSGLMQLFWPKDRMGDARAHMRWDPPGLLLLDVGITDRGAAPEAGLTLPSVHLLAPETAGTTHYFWAFLRNRDIHDPALDEKIGAIGRNAFANEDKPIIEAQQANIGPDADVLALKPIVLSPDAAGLQARRILRRLLEAEATTPAPSPAEQTSNP